MDKNSFHSINVDNDEYRNIKNIKAYQIKPKNTFKDVLSFIKNEKKYEIEKVKCEIEDDVTEKEKDYQIAICQDGKFVITFNTANLRVKLLENTDYREFVFRNRDVYNNKKESYDEPDTDTIDKTIAYFKIKDDLTIDKLYNTDYDKSYSTKEIQDESQVSENSGLKKDEKNETFEWSFDISNMYEENNNECFIFVAISRINVNKDMKVTEENSETKGIVIFRLKFKKENNSYVLSDLSDVTRYYNNEISGICRFVEVSKEEILDDTQQKRLVILDFNWMYSIHINNNDDFFYLNEKFEYPKSIRRELDDWYSTENDKKNYIKRLLSCIYDKYFLATQFENDVQSLEVFDLAKMELETTAKKVEKKDEFVNEYYSSKCPKGDVKIIIWDLYNTSNYEIVELDDSLISIKKDIKTRLARTLGNILQIDDNGTVSSLIKKSDESHKIYYNKKYKNFEPIVDDTEPWVLDEYKKSSYCHYHHQGTEEETLQLIVGRSTVQIWHQINGETKNKKQKEQLPNKGKPFLEYIWTNHIPVNQEREKTKLRIEYFKYEPNVGLHEKLDDFYLKVYWYERKDNKKNSKKEEHEIIKEEDEEIDKIEKQLKENNEKEDIDEAEKEKKKQEIIDGSIKVKRWEKVIKRKDIIEKFHAVRHACKALEHLNKRHKGKRLANNYIRVHRYEEMIRYIKHIVWRFAKYEPKNFKLLDIRYNVMKNLILDNSWPGEKFIKDGDLDFEKKDGIKDNEDIEPKNNMELAIYHCKGRELKDTIIVAYLLEYYSSHATDCAGWMCTVSKAIPLLFKYNYDDYARKLFFKECFADQDHFSAQDPNEIIPPEYRERRNHNIKFRAFRPIVKLKSDNIKWYDNIRNQIKFLNSYIIKNYENFDNDLGKSPIALRIVPLPGFTMNNFEREYKEYNLIKIILNLLSFIFIPRFYQINRCDRKKLSPFSRMIHYENNDDIYDNPATEAVIDFLLQIRYRGFKKYFGEIFNSVDLISTALSVTVMSIMFKNFQFTDGFESLKEIDIRLIVGISFSIFFLWIELIFYLRLIPKIGIFIYYAIIIFKTILPFFLFMLVVMLAFAHTMIVLLRDPTKIKTKDSTYSGIATDISTNETLNITLKSDFDPTSSDNPFSSFFNAILATYFWISGDMVQRDQFDFWTVDVYTLIGSIVLVIVLQNMLIAFMRQTLLRHQANHIADYEALHHIHFWNPEPEPKHIYYFGQSKSLEEWSDTRKDDQGAIYKGFEEKTTFTIRTFKEENYDKSSILEYYDNIETKIGNLKNIGKEM
ncbi:12060_t:CDS:10, partial [Rhizophagus irregularis]